MDGSRRPEADRGFLLNFYGFLNKTRNIMANFKTVLYGTEGSETNNHELTIDSDGDYLYAEIRLAIEDKHPLNNPLENNFIEIALDVSTAIKLVKILKTEINKYK